MSRYGSIPVSGEDIKDERIESAMQEVLESVGKLGDALRFSSFGMRPRAGSASLTEVREEQSD